MSELDAFFGPGNWPDGVEVRPEARKIGFGADEFLSEGAEVWLLDAEIAYHTPGGVEGARRRTRQLRRHSIKLAAIIYDLIPIRRPDYGHDRARHEAYVEYLFELDLLLAISRSTAGEFAAYWKVNGPPVEVCALPDGGFFALGGMEPTSSDRLDLLMVGTVEARKRQVQAVQAFARARRRSPAVAAARLRVIGALSPSVAKVFHDLVRRVPGVDYMDYAPDGVLSAAFAGAAATIFPSEDEGFGLPIAESLSRGVPCLCANFGAMAEVAAGGGCLQVDVRDPAALEQAIVEICEDAALRERLRAEIASRVFRTWAGYAAEVVARLEAAQAATRASRPEVATAAEPEAADVRSGAGDGVAARPDARSGPLMVRLPMRLLSALRRHGPVRVVPFALAMAARTGWLGTMRYALGRGQAPRTPAGLALDAAFSLSSSAWCDWLAKRQAACPQTAPASADLTTQRRLLFCIDGQDAPALAATRASIGELDFAGFSVAEISSTDELDALGAYLVFLKAGDRLDSRFGRLLSQAASPGRADLITFDLVHRLGDRVQPIFLPGANPTLALAAPSLYARFAMATHAVPADWREKSPPELLRGWLEQGAQVRGRWRHAAPFPVVEIERAVVPPCPREADAAAPRGGVSAVICTKDKGHLTRQLVRSLLSLGSAIDEIIIISNNTASPHALQTLRDLAKQPRVRVLQRDEPFNFSRLANAGAAAARGENLLFLNDDITPVTEDWLARMQGWLNHPKVGAVGPLLVYPNERVQHAGMHLGYRGLAGHTLRHAQLPRDEYLYLASAPREVMSLTGAVLLTPRSVFEALNGFDERLATYLQDVDYCLRVRDAGFLNIFEPSAVLIHMESTSVAEIPAESMSAARRPEYDLFVARWEGILDTDPLFPAGLDPNDEGLKTLRPATR